MAEKTTIEWAGATWHPWYCCSEVSEGCENCYARRWAKRTGREWGEPIRAADSGFYKPLTWKEPQLIFVCGLSDFFHPEVCDRDRNAAWGVMHGVPQHTFLILTKRPGAIQRRLPKYDWPWPNVWLGVTAENQQRADERIPKLLEIPAAGHFVSLEPLLGAVDFSPYLPPPIDQERDAGTRRWVSWVFCGGETGGGARPMKPDWPRGLRDQCTAAGVPFLFKQWGEWGPKYDFVRGILVHPDGHTNSPPLIQVTEDAQHYGGAVTMFRVGRKRSGRLLDGKLHDEFPEGLKPFTAEAAGPVGNAENAEAS